MIVVIEGKDEDEALKNLSEIEVHALIALQGEMNLSS